MYGGVQDAASPEALDNIVWFREHGGIVYHHNLTFGPDLQVGHCCSTRAVPELDATLSNSYPYKTAALGNGTQQILPSLYLVCTAPFSGNDV